MGEINLKSQLLEHIKDIEKELSYQLGRGAYSVEKPLKAELEKLWDEYYKIKKQKNEKRK